MKKRAVITGIGIISPLGFGHEEFWKNLIDGRSGISPITCIDTTNYKCKMGVEVKNLQTEQYIGNKGIKYLTKGTKFLASAIKLALQDSGLTTLDSQLECRTGIIIGSALGNYSETTDYTYDIVRNNPSELLPMASYDVALNSSINFASVFFKIKGPARTISSGFISSTDAIGNAYNLIQNGKADIIITGGVEQISLDAYVIFYMQKLLAGSDGKSGEISMPFDERRSGFIMSEGAYVFVMEELEFARSRGVRIYAEVKGYACTNAGRKSGSFRQRLDKAGKPMTEAIEEAGLSPEKVNLISANGNSSKVVDLIEAKAIQEVFRNCEEPPLVNSIKGMTGEPYGASGAMQMASAVLAIRDDIVPPMINYEQRDPECDLNFVDSRLTTPDSRLDTVLINSLDYSGNNACLVIQKFC
ncbi:MAG: beta-ketoacyl-[acyl-carrier-protein] synthase family protein [Planctomycetes bacterium]|nr:beta-ketoacyl-[acyl-carrier-protein] synthase family protein [Planctomycetota bacterium]